MESPVFQFMLALLECDKPVIAAVTGAAIGIGTTMLLHCDFVYVSDEARLAMPFVEPGSGAGVRVVACCLPQLMGQARAAEKLLLGDPFTGADAVECGIANAVLPAGEVVNHARRIAERFNSLPPGAVRERKKLLRGPADRGHPRDHPQSKANCSPRGCAAPRRWRPSRPSSRSASPTSRSSDATPRASAMSLALKLVLAPVLVAAGAAHAQARAGAARGGRAAAGPASARGEMSCGC